MFPSTSWRLLFVLLLIVTMPALAARASVARAPSLHRQEVELARAVAQPIPASNLYTLVDQLKLRPPRPISKVIRRTSPNYPVGHKESFYVLAENKNAYFTLHATIRGESAHMYMYIQDGLAIKDSDVQSAVNHFERSIYPTDRALYGSEWRPGVDGDPHVVCLVGDLQSDSVGGYFSGEDEYPRLVNPYSNQHEMIYLNSANTSPGAPDFDLTLAHEFQHMIHWHMHRHDNAWLNEGMSMLAERVNGYPPSGDGENYLGTPNTQLDTWDGWNGQNTTNGNHYGGSYLFLAYILQHYGRSFIRSMLADGRYTDFELVNDVARKLGTHVTANGLFANWATANYLDNPSVARGTYAYKALPQGSPPTAKSVKPPFSQSIAALPYAAQYIELKNLAGARPFHLQFSAPSSVPLVSVSDKGPFWWSNRGDMSDTRLERDVDLSKVKHAHLHFRLWYQIEKDYDYGFVEASTDGGRTWKTLRGTLTTTSNPYDSNYGNGYTGDSKGWHNETVDLSPFAGKRIKLRFEYITDDTTTGQGMLLKNISIPEIDFKDRYSGWTSHGFVPVSVNALPSAWTVMVITYKTNGVTVSKMPLSAAMSGSVAVDPARQHVKRLVAVIFHAEPKTTVPSTFTLSAR